MSALNAAVSSFLREQDVPRSRALLVAVSGGADSVALLHMLLALGQRVAVGHVHHGLRGEEADADLAFVASLASGLGVRFEARRVEAGRADGRSPEARARELRYSALEKLRAAAGCAAIATAHTLDDQAETVLLRSIRGTGLGGLAAIAPRSGDGRLLRPLLGARRAELRTYLVRRRLAWCEDASNADLAIPRNRLRAEVMPVLEAIHPGAARRLAALARHARLARSAVDAEAAAALAGAVDAADGGLWVDSGALVALAPGSRVRALAELLARVGPADRISEAHLVRIGRFLERADTGAALSLPGGASLFRDRDRVWLGPAPGPRFPEAFCRLLQPPDALELPERGTRLVWRRGREVHCDRDALPLPDPVPGPLFARSPRSGDRMRPDARGRARRLKDLFASARWSQRERARAVVVELNSEVVWVVGLAKSLAVPRLASAPWSLAAERLSAPAVTW